MIIKTDQTEVIQEVNEPQPVKEETETQTLVIPTLALEPVVNACNNNDQPSSETADAVQLWNMSLLASIKVSDSLS